MVDKTGEATHRFYSPPSILQNLYTCLYVTYNAAVMVKNDRRNDDECNDELTEEEEIVAEVSQTEKIKQLRAKLKESETKRLQELENLQRSKADFLNAKRRLEEEKSTIRSSEEVRLAVQLFPLLDSFAQAKADEKIWGSVDKSWRDGFLAIENQLRSILTAMNITEVEALNEHFDPNIHEAVGTKSSDHEPEVVLEVVQTGYMKGDKVLRPAKVIISE